MRIVITIGGVRAVITGNSTLIKSTSTNYATITYGILTQWRTPGKGTITIGTSGASSTSYPYIANGKSGNAISYSSNYVTYNKYSGRVD